MRQFLQHDAALRAAFSQATTVTGTTIRKIKFKLKVVHPRLTLKEGMTGAYHMIVTVTLKGCYGRLLVHLIFMLDGQVSELTFSVFCPALSCSLSFELSSANYNLTPNTIMGNDGGSIPDRRDLVKSKPKVSSASAASIQIPAHSVLQAEQADKANQTRARWFFCALSKVRNQMPIWILPVDTHLSVPSRSRSFHAG